MITKLTQGNANLVNKINEIADLLNALTSPSRGDGRVSLSQTSSGVVSTLMQNQVNPAVPKVLPPIQARRARTTEAATGNNHITCNLYDFKGAEITSGDEAGVEVYLSIAGGSALDEALPRLTNDLDIVVASLPYSSTEYRWYLIGGVFQAAEDCT